MNLREDVKKELLVAAHRGAAGGIIPCNTLASYDAAIAEGAEIVEIDVTRAKDGTLFAFHPHMEAAHLNSACEIPELTAREVKNLRYVTSDRVPTEYGVSTLGEVFQHLKGRCYINIDKLETDIGGIAQAVREYHIQDQVIAKTWADQELFKQVEQYAPDLPYMVMMREKDVWTEYLKDMRLNYLGVEVMFSSEESPLAQKEYVEKMHAMGYYVWCNAIVFDPEVVFAAGHSDEISAVGFPEEGWGWLADRGYDMMQTDWAGAAVRYLKSSGKKYRHCEEWERC